jgi:hypothetical protein
VGRAFGDAIVGFYKNRVSNYTDVPSYPWHTTDDTQLIMATYQTIIEFDGKIIPKAIAQTSLIGKIKAKVPMLH